MVTQRTIVALLHKLGLTPNESKCYLAALRLGEADVHILAKTARVNRSNAYEALSGLVGYGLVDQQVISKKRRVRPAPVEVLRDLARKHQKNATKLRWSIEDLVPVLKTVLPKQDERVGFLALEGPDTLIRLLRRVNLSVEPGTEILEFCMMLDESSAGPRTEEFSKEEYIPERVQLGCSKRMLCVDRPSHRALILKDREELRETRLLEQTSIAGLEHCNVNIFGDEIFFYWEAPQPHGVIIQSKKISDLMRYFFNFVWKQTTSTGDSSHERPINARRHKSS